MFNRRYLRIKVFQALYAYYQDETSSRMSYEKNMLKSLDDARRLYLFLLAFPAEFRHFLSQEISVQQSKHMVSEKIIDQLNALYHNKAILLFDDNVDLQTLFRNYKIKWSQSADLMRSIYNLLRTHSLYTSYLEIKNPTFDNDRKFFSELIELLIADSEPFNQYMEEHFLNWEDDQLLVITKLIKDIGQLKANEKTFDFIPSEKYASEDLAMMKDLFNKTIDSDEEFVSLIASKTQNWEADRIALVDMLLMKMALSEILYSPYIPVKVSINEYLELAKLYSTPNSHTFINGVLDKIHHELKSSGKIQKQGRGLVE